MMSCLEGLFTRLRGDVVAMTGALLVLLLAQMPMARGENVVSVGLGFDYSYGDYGDAIPTKIIFIPVFGKWESDPWVMKISVPYVHITGPGRIVLNGEKPITADDLAPRKTSESGLGDTVLSVVRTVWTGGGSGVALDVGGKIKLPTADETKGLGTGETDYAVMMDLYGSLSRLSLFAGVSYRWMGDPPQTQYRNVWSANTGLSYRFGPSLAAGAMYDYRQSTYSGMPGASEVTPFLSWKLGRDIKLQLYGTLGFSDGSPDHGIGLVLQQSY